MRPPAKVHHRSSSSHSSTHPAAKTSSSSSRQLVGGGGIEVGEALVATEDARDLLAKDTWRVVGIKQEVWEAGMRTVFSESEAAEARASAVEPTPQSTNSTVKG